ncbi:YktB family protein [Neobacillus fumarioli]|uniref:YktB family protein n=1 Tax=Neobacillus fumarioli TaxID=105229 RepID=UPI00082A0F9B|nr:DUF1054 domain-containing protein [Neobacillus fumarioli]
MDFKGFTKDDFDTFLIEGLEPRMEAIKGVVRPKLESLGAIFAPTLTAITGDEMFFHVAKHARRTTNAPNDTWVAFASNPRGYKMLSHFQIGLWHTHLFIWFAIIYEAPNKVEIGARFADSVNKIYNEIPKDFVWSLDHTKPESIQHETMSKNDLLAHFERLQTIKKAEILCGLSISREEAIKLDTNKLLEKIKYAFTKTAPLYKLAVHG